MTIKQYQKILKEKGYYFGAVDGISGPLTEAAVCNFQADYDLAVDGICGPITQSKLAEAESINWQKIKYFKRREFRCQCGGDYCQGYPAHLAEQLLYILDSLRTHYRKPIYISSGLRCTKHNANVGGVERSRHKTGRAADITLDGINDELIADIIARAYSLGASYAYSNDEGMAGAVHIQVG